MKRKLPPHIVLPDGRWRFVKRGSKNVSKRKSHRGGVHMARKGKRHFSRGGFGFGSMKSMIWPIAAGVADSYIDPLSPVDGLGATFIGMIGKDPALKTIGLYKLGASLGNIIPLPGRGTVASTGAML